MKKQLWLFLAITFFSSFEYPKQERRITFSVTLNQAQVILKGLGKLPLEESGDLFMDLQAQANQQINPLPVKPNNRPDTTVKKH